MGKLYRKKSRDVLLHQNLTESKQVYSTLTNVSIIVLYGVIVTPFNDLFSLQKPSFETALNNP